MELFWTGQDITFLGGVAFLVGFAGLYWCTAQIILGTWRRYINWHLRRFPEDLETLRRYYSKKQY